MKQLSTRRLLLAGSCLASLAITPPRAFAQTNLDPVQQQWAVNEAAGTPISTLTALKVATDAAGNVYTLSQLKGGRNNTGSFVTSKYSPSGQRLWQNFYTSGSPGGSYAADLALDASGNVYVTGASSTPVTFRDVYTTVRYSTAGFQQWVSQYEATGADVARAIAVDASGNAYVTGSSGGDYATVKYNAAGQQQWASRYSNGGAEAAIDIAVDASGNAVVTGTATNGNPYSDLFTTVAYNAAGQQQWVSSYDSGGTDAATAVALDAAGNAYVTGSASGDYATLKYSPTGQQQWVARYNGPGNAADTPQDLAVSTTGMVFVTGSSVGTAGDTDYATVSYSTGGQQLWASRYNGGGTDMAYAIALDEASNAYVTGSSVLTGYGTAFITIKYASANGQQRWLARYNPTTGPTAPADQATARDIALDAQRNVLVAGSFSSYTTISGVATVKYVQGTPGTGCNPLATEPSVPTQRLATAVGAPLTFTAASLLMGATDPLGRTLQVASIAKPSAGTLVKNADGSYTYTPQAGYTGPVSLSYVVQEAGPVLASPQTRHYYEFVSAPGISWAEAKAAAAARSYQGLQGYLATITYQGEEDFVSGRQMGQYWLGASDETTEGEWRWSTGPEAGTLIWRGTATGYGTAYTNWQPGQPDDYKNQYRPQGEDYALFYGQSGYWNDVDGTATGASVAGYLVEYGGLESCTPVLYTLGTLTIQVGNTSQAALARLASGSAAQATAAPGVATLLEAMPNPSHGQFRVRVTASQDGAAQLDLFDVQGRRVRALYSGSLAAGETRELAVDDASLAAGLYQLRLQSAEGTRSLRLSVQP